MELLIGSVGAIQSAFMFLYLCLGKKRNTTNLLLAFFLFLITLRVVKSLLWVYLDFVPDWFINLGFAAHLASGSALFLYLYHVLLSMRWNHWNSLHFLPAFILLLFLNKPDETNFWFIGGYTFLLYHQLAYTLLSIGILLYGLIKDKSRFNAREIIWLTILMLGAAGIQFAYFSNYILGLTPYLAGPMIYAFFIYAIALYGLINHKIFDTGKRVMKYGNINMSEESFSFFKDQIADFMEKGQPYLNPEFTLQKLSREIALPSYLTSHVINKGHNTNFSDFINSYRIDLAKSKLGSSSYNHIKISEIAYECGFNSLSSFNTSFKKQTGMTPSQFRTNGK
jgi:AraC-like DNA-binding protein